MSTVIMSACWPLQMPPTQKAVLISLADNANDQGECWPSQTKIAERTCLNERTVRNAIRWLEENGYLVADRSNGRHTRYVVIPTPEPRSTPERRSAPESGSGVPRNLVPKPRNLVPVPRNDVPPNRKEPKATSKKKTAQVTFDVWTDQLGDQDAILADDPIHTWAAGAGIPDEYLELAWLAFDDRFTGADKTYADWRAAFRNYVKNGWLGLWKASRDGGYYLTDAGLQWQRVRDGLMQEAA